MFSFLNNIPPVTKNLLFLNVMFYVVTKILLFQGIDLGQSFGAHYFNSPLFEPYQVITHMFMHDQGSIMHILFNMLILVMFGAHLERLWGAKRYFIFYIAAGLGAYLLYSSIGVYELSQIKAYLSQHDVNVAALDNIIRTEGVQSFHSEGNPVLDSYLQSYIGLSMSNMIGASGALFGIMAGFAVLFPNTELMLIFFPMPIKAKYLIGAYLLFEVYSSVAGSADNVAHLAHVGGAIVGIALVLFWRKKDRSNFW